MSQFKALIYKNWILFKRSWLGSFLELFLPIIFVVFVFVVRRITTTTNYDQKQYVDTKVQNISYTINLNPNPIPAFIPFLMKSCINNKVSGNVQRNGNVALAPAGDPLINNLSTILQGLGYNIQMFNSDSQINAYVRDLNYGLDSTHTRLCFGVTVDSSSGNYQYNLRYNITAQQSNSQGPNSQGKSTVDKKFNSYTITAPMLSGMLETNTIMLNLITQKQLGSTYSINPIVAPMTQQAYYDDPIFSNLANSMDILCLLPLLIVYLRQISAMLEQKEKKIRQTMKIMGMSQITYFATWFIRYFAVYCVIHIICSLILARALGVNFGLIFVIFILFDIVLIIQAFFIQIFFTRAKLGMVIGLLFFIIQYIIHFISSNSDNPDITQFIYTSISPHAAFISALSQILYASSVQINLDFSYVSSNINNYSLAIAIVSFIIHIIVWLLLTIYLQQVFPNEWGAKKHPLFFINWLWRKENNTQQEELMQMKQPLENIQVVEQKFKQMEKLNQTIKFINVNKEFDTGKKAVKDLNLTIYNDQIFVLLGHNGAGKTTTISMLSGLLDLTSGKIQALGYNTATDMDQLRNYMGICPQHDTLYDQLTVQEHLYLFGTFKGYDSSKLDTEVQKLIRDVNLVQKSDYYAKDLSGGQRRRLSVALSFIGGSKLIFLDEPTSGMDTSARRYIWQMLKNYKNDRIIILTTHFMDEADFLGDRIGIMGNGKLICAGSSIFLKNKFGVGYNITIVKQTSKVDSQPIINMIKDIIQSAKVTTNVSSQIAIQLSMEDINRFPKLFDVLDNNKKRLGIETYGVSITTLEEVFLKVAQINHQSDQIKDVSDPTNKQILKEESSQNRIIPIQNSLNNLSNEQPNSVIRHLLAILVKRYRIAKRDLKTVSFQLIFPVVIIILTLFLLRITFVTDFSSQTMDLTVFSKQTKLSPIPVSGNQSSTFINSLTNQLNIDSSNLNATVFNSNDAQSFDTNIIFPIKNTSLKAGIFIVPRISNTLIFYTIINTRSPTTPFIYPTLVTQAYINSIAATPITIKVVNKPFPRTFQQLQLNNTISGFLAAFIFSVALAFKFASVISFIVKERQDKCKHQQIVSGMSIYSYWFGNFIFDYLFYIVIAIFAAGMCQAFGISSLTNGDALTATWVLFVLYGLTNLPFTYIVSFLFKDYGNSQAGWYFFNFVCGGILSIIILLLRFISIDTNPIGRGIAWVLRLIPAYCFGEGLINEGSITLISIIQNKGKLLNIFNYQITLSPIIYLIIEFVAYFVILFLIQYLSNTQKFMRFFSRQNTVPYVETTYDDDVITQMIKAQSADPKEYTIITKNLRKVYVMQDKNKIAVDKLSFAVQKGEVFGLLGINGAGKTTTFKMLAGQITSTSGQAYFNGMLISENLDKVRRNLGYCPQFDALLENLTVRQQLELYFDMKGLPLQHKENLISIKIQEMNLGQYQHVLSGTLSGGNKRKLSVACAIIGDPSIIFLDQPSTGMDPQARRFMWKIISSIATLKKQSTIILTTHSMEQAEALSTRLGIMVNGNFKCIGTTQHLKSKFGEGYQIEVKLMTPTKGELLNRLRKSGLQQDKLVNIQNLSEILNKLCNDQKIKSEISAQGTGKYLIKQLKESKVMSTAPFIEFIFIQQNGKMVMEFIQKNLGAVEIIENFQAFFRFRLKAKIPIGKVFQKFQQNKINLYIQQYSIKQASVQQIFNKLAAQYEQEQL